MTRNNLASTNKVLSSIQAPINERRWLSSKEIAFTWTGIFFTLMATTLVAWEQGPILAEQYLQHEWAALALHALFLLIAAFLVYGGLVYLSTRLGYIRRLRQHAPANREEMDEILCNENTPSLTVLVPSYKEDRNVIYQTLMSAALQEYPYRRVVLLIDDAPNPTSAVDMTQLAAARELPLHIASLLQPIARQMADARGAFLHRANQGNVNNALHTAELIGLWRHAAEWYACRTTEHDLGDHAECLFVEQVLRQREARCHQRMQELSKGPALFLSALNSEYRKLAILFECELCNFERKRYVNLSHEPNKAMNLNSYIHLTGKHYRQRMTEKGRWLEEVEEAHATMSVPAARYLVTLDADSILLPEYALRLIHIMEQPGNERLAVAQTPYSAFPGASSTLERIAGATTDMQYIIHQGFTRYNATYWVGANALLRRAALDAIAETDVERGHIITRYIQDRTVIEDTESSVDLAARGWTLYNYPARLAYSATPSDFGAVVIQRRRWANGGLIILPKLLGYLAHQPHIKVGEGLLRLHYLISIATVNVGLLLLMAFPFTESIKTVWMPLTALPYYLLYGRDLVLCGYRATDLFRVYAFNLLLIPVNLGGVLKSLQQAITRQRIPFGRTPKIKGRTATPPLYVIATYALLADWLFSASGNFIDGYTTQGILALINAAILLYAISVFVGFRASWEDITVSLGETAAAQSLSSDDIVVGTDKVVMFHTKGLSSFQQNVTFNDERSGDSRTNQGSDPRYRKYTPVP